MSKFESNLEQLCICRKLHSSSAQTRTIITGNTVLSVIVILHYNSTTGQDTTTSEVTIASMKRNGPMLWSDMIPHHTFTLRSFQTCLIMVCRFSLL